MKTKFSVHRCARRHRAGGDGGALAGGSAKADGTLSGAGATFPFPLISQWQKDYESKTGTKINYNPIGSGRRHRRDHRPHGRLRRE